MMTERAEDFYASLSTDLRRRRVEADFVDVKYLVGEAEHALAHVGQWMEPMRVSSLRMLVPSHTRVRFDPLGVGLIIGTWNYL
jgi:aldehyde dehydrogenase (NAD+)